MVNNIIVDHFIDVCDWVNDCFSVLVRFLLFFVYKFRCEEGKHLEVTHIRQKTHDKMMIKIIEAFQLEKF